METLSARPTLRGLDADQFFRDPIPTTKLSRLDTTKSLPVLFGNMGQPSAGWMRVFKQCLHRSEEEIVEQPEIAWRAASTQLRIWE